MSETLSFDRGAALPLRVGKREAIGAPVQTTEEPIRILLVDDRPENLVSLEAVLATPGYELIKVGSGKEALRYLLDHDCAMILMDVQMPEMDGFETAQLVHQRQRSRAVPIIFVTAVSSDARYVMRGYESGAVDYLFKPIEPEILRSKVAVFASLERARRAVVRQSRQIQEHEREARQRALAELERKSAARQEALERKYGELIEGLEHAIVWAMDPVSLACTFVSRSAETILGFSRERWTEPSFLVDRVEASDRGRLLDAVRQVAENGRPKQVEHRSVASGGSVVCLRTSIRRESRASGHGFELRCLSVDVTELKGAIQMREDFLSIASHEMRTPLAALQLTVHNLRRLVSSADASLDVEKVVARVASTERQVGRLAKLVETLLDVSRFRAGRLTLVREVFDLAGLVEETVARMAEAPHAQGTQIRVQCHGPVLGRWDRNRLEQVVVNVVDNAIKYGDRKPIDVRLRRDGDLAVVEVEDRGIGIAKADRRRIFARFERTSHAASFSGLGLGLFICHEIVEAHGGAIRVESEVGAGTTIRIELPLPVSA